MYLKYIFFGHFRDFSINLIIGYFNAIGAGTTVLIMPFAQKIIDKIGNIHIIFIAILAECGRLVLFSIIK